MAAQPAFQPIQEPANAFGHFGDLRHDPGRRQQNDHAIASTSGLSWEEAVRAQPAGSQQQHSTVTVGEDAAGSFGLELGGVDLEDAFQRYKTGLQLEGEDPELRARFAQQVCACMH